MTGGTLAGGGSAELHELTVLEAGQLIRNGELTSEALVRNALARVEAMDGELNGFVHVARDRAIADARRLDAELRSGEDRGPLHGIPVALKDIIDVAGMPTTCQSKLRSDHVAREDSAVARRLTDAGAIILGKANTWQFARGEPGPNLLFPPARNPLSQSRTPGGSSSGSGVVLAARYVRIAIGTDTGGSIRYPAACCGVVGLKPTFGLVGRSGIFPLTPSMDHCGPMAGSVEEAAIALQVIAGYDPLDFDSYRAEASDYLGALDNGVSGLRIGIPRALFTQSSEQSEQIGALETLSTRLKHEGATIIDPIETPPYQEFIDHGLVVMLAESYVVHRESLKTDSAAYDPPTLQLFMAGAAYTPTQIEAARSGSKALKERLSKVFSDVDVLIMPTMLRTALPLGQSAEPTNVLTIPFDVTGHPALAMPAGVATDGMPLSIQLIGRHFDEATILRVGRTIEKLVTS